MKDNKKNEKGLFIDAAKETLPFLANLGISTYINGTEKLLLITCYSGI